MLESFQETLRYHSALKLENAVHVLVAVNDAHFTLLVDAFIGPRCAALFQLTKGGLLVLGTARFAYLHLRVLFHKLAFTKLGNLQDVTQKVEGTSGRGGRGEGSVSKCQ